MASKARRSARWTGPIVVAVVLGVVASQLTASAATTSLTMYTGCLKSGTLINVAAGGSPKTACPTGTTVVHLSSGLSAGSGLTVTGGNSLSVNTSTIQSRVTGSCPVGSSVAAVSATGAVTCRAGALSANIDITTSNTYVPIVLRGGDTIYDRCTVTGNLGYPEAQIEVVPTSVNATTRYYVHGYVDVQTKDTTSYLDAGTNPSFPAGHSLIGQYTASNYFFINALPASPSTPTFADVHLLVNHGSTIFTIEASLYSANDRCQATVEVIPGS
jgi:hypothetical protein